MAVIAFQYNSENVLEVWNLRKVKEAEEGWSLPQPPLSLSPSPSLELIAVESSLHSLSKKHKYSYTHVFLYVYLPWFHVNKACCAFSTCDMFWIFYVFSLFYLFGQVMDIPFLTFTFKTNCYNIIRTSLKWSVHRQLLKSTYWRSCYIQFKNCL